jgi:predicted metalloprotease
MTSLRKNVSLLRKLKSSKPSVRNKILKNADKELVTCICECAYNTLNNNVPLSRGQLNRLARHKRTLRKLAKRGESWKKKHKIISQSGGFILPLLAPIIGGLLQKYLF